MKLTIERSVTVITPTIGKPELTQSIKSVKNQTYGCKHIVVVDGIEHYKKVCEVSDLHANMRVCVTPENTGANGFNGQRIYAAFPHLVNSDYILFLDEDNWFEPNHVESLIKTIEQHNLAFAYSLRKVHRKDGSFACNDDCESLGQWPIFLSNNMPEKHHLIDTSSYCFRREFIQKTCHLWHSGPWGEDRRYYNAVKNFGGHGTSGEYTLCYRLDGNPKSVTEDFFINGNELNRQYYGGTFPWRKI